MLTRFAALIALVSLCSAARAERIQIVGVVANYVTARNAVDIEIWLDRPLDMQSEWLSFGAGKSAVMSGADGVRFSFSNGPVNQPPRDYFDLVASRRVSGSVVERETIDRFPVDIEERMRDGNMRHVISASISADDAWLDQIIPDHYGQSTFTFAATVRFINDNGYLDTDSISGISTVNAPTLIHTPEPSTFILLGIAALHLIAIPRLRVRRAKRQAIEPTSERVGAV
jgi:hypothetical protein